MESISDQSCSDGSDSCGSVHYFHRPWNYLVMIVLLLAEGMYVWNRIKEGKRSRKVRWRKSRKGIG